MLDWMFGKKVVTLDRANYYLGGSS